MQECIVIHLFRILKNGHPMNKRRCFLEDLHPFSSNRSIKIGEAGNIFAWSSITADEATADRVGNLGEYDRNRASERLQYREHGGAINNDDVRWQADKLGRVGLHMIGFAGDPTNFDLDVASLRPSQLDRKSTRLNSSH